MLIIIIVCFLFVAPGCSSSSGKINNGAPNLPTPGKLSLPPENPFIPGKYVAAEEGNFYTVWDTIVIVRVSNQQNRFQISRRSAFQKSTTASDQTIEHDRIEWLGLFDDVSQMLSGINRNIDLQCIPARQQISLEGIVYNRVE
jgi:hypothetical protein